MGAWAGCAAGAREIGLDLLAILWPTECVGCGAPDRDCCDRCRGEVRDARGSSVWVSAPTGAVVCVAGLYEGPLRALLVACKHQGRTGFSSELGARLRAPLRAALDRARGPSPPVLVTVPSRPARVRERGYRHVDLMLRAALRQERRDRSREGRARLRELQAGSREGCARLRERCARPGERRDRRWEFVPRALRTLRGRTTQVGLNTEQRRRNASLVAVRRSSRAGLRGREVILVDDVITTGATVDAAARALGDAGATVIAVVALCVVERRSLRSLRSHASSPRTSIADPLAPRSSWERNPDPRWNWKTRAEPE